MLFVICTMMCLKRGISKPMKRDGPLPQAARAVPGKLYGTYRWKTEDITTMMTGAL